MSTPAVFPEETALVPCNEDEEWSVGDADECDVDLVEPARGDHEFER